MKNFNFKKIVIPAAVSVSIIFFSCKKMIEIDPPNNQLVSTVVFNDSADATAAVVGMYAAIMQASTFINVGSGAITVYTGLAADEIYPTSTDQMIQEFYTNSIAAQNGENAALWEISYQLIYQANACIEGLTTSTSLKADVKNQLLGEAKFIRAWLYFNLVNLFGDVPLALSIDYQQNSVMRRTPLQEVYDHIVKDLEHASNLLPPAYITAGKLRPNKFSAISLLARIYLFQKKWEQAAAAADEVINSGIYSLETGLNSVFINYSSETIWQMLPLQVPIGVPEAFQFIPFNASIIPNYAISNSLYSSFETGDQRKQDWLKSSTIAGQVFIYPFKYKLIVSPATDEYYVVLRLAELYLIRSEARAMQDDYLGALLDLNAIRNRAGLSDYNATDREDLLTAILKERQVEYFCEGGHRWADLKRTDKINTTLRLTKAGWQLTDAFFPVPFSELQLNPFLTQNQGY